MRVLLVNNFGRITGGADKYVFELRNLLIDNGHSASLLSTTDDRDEVQVDYGIRQRVDRDSKYYLNRWDAAKVAACAIWNPEAYRVAMEAISQFAPDIMHVHKLYPQVSVAPLVAAQRCGVPVVQTIHDYEFVSADEETTSKSWVDRRLNRTARERLLNSLLFLQRRCMHKKHVDGWIAVSNYVSDICRRHAISARTIEHFQLPSATRPPNFEQRSGVAFIGRLEQLKGIDAYIELARELPDLTFWVAGAGSASGEVEHAARDSNLSYLGSISQEEVFQLMRTVRVVVIPSMWEEPAGLIALEAMAEGAAIVVSDRGGLAEIGAYATQGLGVSREFSELKPKVQALHWDRTKWEVAVKAGYIALRDRHSPELHMKRLDAVYNDVLRFTARRGTKVELVK